MDEEQRMKKEFHGLYTSEASCRSESDDSSYEKGVKKDGGRSKKKEKNNDKGYAALDSQSSEDESENLDHKNTSKSKLPFKFLHKKDREEKEKDDKRRKDKSEKDERKKEKKREKEKKIKEKEQRRKLKKEKKKKLHEDKVHEDSSVFGIPLAIGVERNPCHDRVRLPRVVRECIDLIEEKGLTCEGIYRGGSSKSKVQALRRAYNEGEVVSLSEQHPHNVASLLKHYLRELPETVLTVDMMPHFEDISLIPNPRERAEAMKQLIDRLPTPNRTLLRYLLKHFGNVIEKDEAKMSYHSICVVLSPILRISHRVLNVMFHSHHYLVCDVQLKKYIPPISNFDLSGRSVDDLNSLEEIVEEMGKQESLLAFLHDSIATGKISQKKEEQLWEAQRNVTLLKRKLKNFQKIGSVEASNVSSATTSDKEESSIDLKTTEMESNEIPSSETSQTSNKDPESDQLPLKSSTENSDQDQQSYIPHKDSKTLDSSTKSVSNHGAVKLEIVEQSESLKNSFSDVMKDNNEDSKIAQNSLRETRVGHEKDVSTDPIKGLDKGYKSWERPVLELFDESTEVEDIEKESARTALEHEEMLALNQELTRKLQFEKSEVTRLRDEIQELQTLYAYRTHSYDSSESDNSESDGDSDNEDEIMKRIVRIQEENAKIQVENGELVNRIHEERVNIIGLKVALRQDEIKSL